MGVDERSAAFDALVVGRSRALLGTAYLLTGDWQRAEDLLQHALVVTWEHWRSLREPAAAEAYVRQVMAHAASRWWRRRWRGEVPTDVLPDRRDSPADPADEASTRVALATALAALTARQRAVLVLRFYEDLSEAEVASALGVSVGTVKSTASRALTALRERPGLAGLVDEEDWS